MENQLMTTTEAIDPVFMFIFGACLVLLVGITVATVLITRADLGAWKVWAALAIASLKCGLVIAFFMHMKYEARLFRTILFVALVTLAIFIGLTFFDVLYR